MTKQDILEIQIESDLEDLKNDVDAGMYIQGNLEDFLERKRRLDQKIGEFKVLRDFEREQELADLTKEMKGKIIQIWDEDRGWISSCGNCDKTLSPDSVKNGKICPFCFVEFKEKVRV